MQLRYILILILSSVIFTQDDHSEHDDSKGYIKGQVLSEDTGLPVQYAIVSLISKKNNKVSNGTMTNEIGGFKLEELVSGNYDLLIESTGYEKMVLPGQLIVPPNMEKDIGLLMGQIFQRFLIQAQIPIMVECLALV